MNLIKKKLRSQAGESITETLVGLLISAFALMMLAGAISTAQRVIDASEAKMQEYYQANSAMIDKVNKVAEKVPVSLTDSSGNTVGLPVANQVDCYSNSVFSDTVVLYAIGG